MLKSGDKVKYRDLLGEIISVINEIAIVKLPDGKEYSLPYNELKAQSCVVTEPMNMAGAIQAFKPFVKNIGFLNDLAKVMEQVGIQELSIKNGSVMTFLTKESLEERIARYKSEAEKKAKEDYERENLSIV